MHIREATPIDAAALALVGAATFLETFAGILQGADIIAHCGTHHTSSTYARWLADESYQLWLAEVREAPVGYLVLGPVDLPIADVRPTDGEIKRVYLLRRFQGTGAGRELISRAAAAVKARGGGQLLLGVYSGNERAIGFYRHVGFETVGARRFRVGEHEYDDLVMGWKLPEQ